VSVDAVTWRVIGLVLTLVGLAVTVLVWRRRGVAAGVRALAWSLLPLAAGLTGTLRLLADIAEAVTRWAVHLVFSPVVWVGVALAGLSAALFVLSAFLRRHAPRPATRRRGLPAPAPSHAAGGEDAEVEAILRRHGIG
jgi:hypothetical protein